MRREPKGFRENDLPGLIPRATRVTDGTGSPVRFLLASKRDRMLETRLQTDLHRC
jgi:hypothetical protein